jgi:hypothetical protein
MGTSKIEYFLQKIPLLILSPTNVAVFNISASTIHCVLHIPMRDMSNLQRLCIINLQGEMRHAKYILMMR